MFIVYQNRKVKEKGPLTKEYILKLRGNKIRLTLKDGSIINGYHEPSLSDDGLEFIPDYVLVITKMLGQYDPYMEKIAFDDIVKVEEILFSSLRWTGKIDFSFDLEEE